MTDRLTKLKQLEAKLETALDECEGDKVAPLAKQYRETLREIDEIEGLNAIDALHDTEFQGRKIVVKKAIPLEENIHTQRRRWIARAERKCHS